MMLSSSRWENVGKAAKPQARRTPSGAAFLWLHVTRRGTASPGISSGGGTGTPSGPSPPPLVRGSFPLYGDFGLPFGSHFLSLKNLRFLDILCHCNTFCAVWQVRMGWLCGNQFCLFVGPAALGGPMQRRCCLNGDPPRGAGPTESPAPTAVNLGLPFGGVWGKMIAGRTSYCFLFRKQ